MCCSVDWPHTLLCTCEGRSGTCILLALCGIHNPTENSLSAIKAGSRDFYQNIYMFGVDFILNAAIYGDQV